MLPAVRNGAGGTSRQGIEDPCWFSSTVRLREQLCLPAESTDPSAALALRRSMVLLVALEAWPVRAACPALG